MTDKEIIKALEICIKCEYGSCYECPFDEICGCDTELKKSTLDLINRQKAEIEEKKRKLQEIMPIVVELKTVAVKEFAEEFEKRCIASGIYPAVTKNILKNLVKELTKTPQERLNDIAMRKGVMSKKINCGNCVYAKPVRAFGNSKCYVECTNKEHLERYCKYHEISKIRQKTNRACKLYVEKKEQEKEMSDLKTCQDCIHYDVCKDLICDEQCTKDTPEYIKKMFSPKGCEDFKNKANFVEVKHGEWLKTEAYPHRVYCSLCYKTYVSNEEVIQGRSWQHPMYCTEAEYCPHCGAIMDGKEELK